MNLMKMGFSQKKENDMITLCVCFAASVFAFFCMRYLEPKASLDHVSVAVIAFIVSFMFTFPFEIVAYTEVGKNDYQEILKMKNNPAVDRLIDDYMSDGKITGWEYMNIRSEYNSEYKESIKKEIMK